MKRKTRYISFIILILSASVLIFSIEPGPGFLYENAKGDCSGRSRFMYNAIYKNANTPGFIFLGSSKTMNGINDSLMNAISQEKYLNLGYCRFGRNMDYFFADEFFKTHKPNGIVLEVREEEGNSVHPVTPFLLPVSSITENIFTLSPGIFQNLYDKALCNLKYLRGRCFGDLPPSPPPTQTDHGFWYGTKKTDTAALIVKRAADSLKYIENVRKPGGLNLNSELYIKKLKALCDRNSAALFFLYLPEYGNLAGRPLENKSYTQYGKLLIPPDSITKNVLNFSDYGHLNKRGADHISVWLHQKLILIQKPR